MKTQNKMSTGNLVMAALLAAIIFVLQMFVGASIKIGAFSLNLVLVPIVIGAATCGIWAGTWLGLVSGITVLLSGDAGLFMPINPLATIAVVLIKGIACGFCAALIYEWLKKLNKYIAVFAAAIVCPIVNTGIFIIGCRLFFMELVPAGGNAFIGIIVAFVGINFLIELAANVVLSPVIVRLLNIRKA